MTPPLNVAIVAERLTKHLSIMRGTMGILHVCSAAALFVSAVVIYSTMTLPIMPRALSSSHSILPVTYPLQVNASSIRSSISEYSSEEEHDARRYRFPSVEDRVKIYMGSWYAPPCKGDAITKVSYNVVNETREGIITERLLLVREIGESESPQQRTFVAIQQLVFANVILLERHGMIDCFDNPYCEDIKKYILTTLDRVDITSSLTERSIPTILQ
jgi:hypothetical protein